MNIHHLSENAMDQIVYLTDMVMTDLQDNGENSSIILLQLKCL